MKKNAFLSRGMVKSDIDFWDRETEIRDIYSLLLDSEEQPQSVVIVGQRRIGKSSLLYRVTKKKMMDNIYSDVIGRVVCIMLSMQMFTSSSPEEFFLRILTQLQRERQDLKEIIDEIKLKYGSHIDMCLEDTLQHIDDEGLTLVLLLDEFESAAQNPKFDKAFFDKLRSFAQHWRLAYVVATQHDLDQLWDRSLISSPLSSPFFNFFQTITLTGFDQDNTLAYLKKVSSANGRPFNDNEIDIIQRVGGRHPFFINIAAYHIFKRSEHDNADQQESYFYVAADQLIQSNFRYYWNNLTSEQKYILIYLTRGQNYDLNVEQIVDLRYLERMSLIVRGNDGSYLPFSVAFSEFIRLSHNINKQDISSLNETDFKQKNDMSQSNRETIISGQLPSTVPSMKVQQSVHGLFEQFTNREALKPRELIFQLQLLPRTTTTFQVRLIEATVGGEYHSTTRLPYSFDELTVVLKALHQRVFLPDDFKEDQVKVLRRLGLLVDSHFAHNFLQIVGQRLFSALMTGEVGTAFQMTMNQARTTESTIAVQLRFDEDAVKLSRYPWELLHDNRRHLLPSGIIQMSRYITYPESPTTINVRPPFRLLYLEPRPTDIDPLVSGDERERVRQALRRLEQEGIVEIIDLIPPTLEKLIDYLHDEVVHILHFDGHGQFARRCQICSQLNYPHLTICVRCRTNLNLISPAGYLALEDQSSERKVHWLESDTLGHYLYKARLRLAVLSACSTGTVRGNSIFTGVGPALVQAGVPAVLANQLPISAKAASTFIHRFYRSLARYNSVSAAVEFGRQILFEGGEWFIPTLYLRSRDHEGKLFTI